MYRIMLVDDDENVLKAVRRVLLAAAPPAMQLSIETFQSPIKALRCARVESFDLAISDYRMTMDGVAFLSALRQIQPKVARVLLTGYSTQEVMLKAINDAAVDRFVCKPWDNEVLATTVLELLAERSAAAAADPVPALRS